MLVEVPCCFSDLVDIFIAVTFHPLNSNCRVGSQCRRFVVLAVIITDALKKAARGLTIV